MVLSVDIEIEIKINQITSQLMGRSEWPNYHDWKIMQQAEVG